LQIAAFLVKWFAHDFPKINIIWDNVVVAQQESKLQLKNALCTIQYKV